VLFALVATPTPMSSLALTRTISANVSRRSSVASIMAYGEETQHYNSRRASVNAAQPEQPPKPNPAIDLGVIPRIESPASTPYFHNNDPDHDDFDVATLKPMAALHMLSRSVQGLMDYTGNIPPTPPVSIPSSPLPAHMREVQSPSRPATPPSAVPSHDICAPGFKKVEIGSPETTYAEPSHVGAGAQTIRAQREAVARKFFSKQPPPICIHEYLLRLHRYLPMSTGVYLAAGVYIHKLAIEERTVPVTPRTAHRLLLGRSQLSACTLLGCWRR
jgi:hypothetical protein